MVPFQLGVSPPATHCPGIHQRPTSCGCAGSLRSEMPFSTTIWPPPAQSTWPTSRTPFAELMMLASFLELNAIGTLQGQHLPCFRRRRHLIAELLDDAPDLRHLLGVARRKLAGADV